MRLTAETPEALRLLGSRLAGVARPGDLILADGPLGAGKTVLAQGLGLGLGLPEGTVKSPTYTVADRHEGGRLPFVHIDAWRLHSAAELEDLDLDLDDALTYVEWGSDRGEGLAVQWLHVAIDRADDERRTVDLTAHGADWAARLSVLGAA